MAGNDDTQDPDDSDSPTAQASPGTTNDGANSWYYRPPSGMGDWASRLTTLPQANTTGGTIKGEDLQLSGDSSTGTATATDSQPDMQSLQDTYNAQKQANAQFGQDQPLALGATSGNGNTADFLARQPLQLQQNTGGAASHVSSGTGGGTDAVPPDNGSLPFENRPYDAMMNALKDGTRTKPSSDDEQKGLWTVQQYYEAMAGNKPYSFDQDGRLSLNGPDKVAAYDQFVRDGLLMDEKAGAEIRSRLAQGLPVDTSSLGSYSAHSRMSNGMGDVGLSVTQGNGVTGAGSPLIIGNNGALNGTIVQMQDGRYGRLYQQPLDNPHGHYSIIPITAIPEPHGSPAGTPQTQPPPAAPPTAIPPPPRVPPPDAPQQNPPANHPQPPAPAPQPPPPAAPPAVAPPARVPAPNVPPPAGNANAGRDAMAQQIVNYEARRDRQGNLRVYQPLADDGGGAFEVAGITEHYDPAMAERLRNLVQGGRPREAEAMARDYIAQQTDDASHWTNNPAIEFYLRDCIFNRGRGGAAMILQTALGLAADGGVGPVTLAAERQAERDPAALLLRLRAAREQYEYQHVGYRADLNNGLVNRWNNALQHAQTLLPGH